MKCQDVRSALSFLVAGELPLTEWAIVESHLRDCAECGGELDRVRVQAAERARARRRKVTVAVLGATVVLLAGAAGGFHAYQRGGLPELPRLDAFRLPPWGAAPPPPRTPAPAPAPEPPAPLAPTAVAPPSIPPSAIPAPEPAPRAARPAATAEVPTPERMPTQARPPAAPGASPGAEAMPTQAPSRSGPRSR